MEKGGRNCGNSTGHAPSGFIPQITRTATSSYGCGLSTGPLEDLSSRRLKKALPFDTG